MANKDAGEAMVPGLFRRGVRDEGLGMQRLIWAMAAVCPVCGKFYTYEFKGRGRPDPGDVLLRRVTACAECSEALEKAHAKARPPKARPSRKRKKARPEPAESDWMI